MPGLKGMKKRMAFYHGWNSDGRNVDGKWRSFNSALDNSYQAEWITFKHRKMRCLINPDKLKPDYDQKEISIDYRSGMKAGDVFYWNRTRKHWIVYMQHYEEEAYFRATIRECDYMIEVDGKPYWIYLRGPVETALIWRQKHQIEMNELNYSLMFYISKDEKTTEFFERLKVVKFDGHNWRVAATDKYSQDGLIEVYLEEYFDNAIEDMNVADIKTYEEEQAKLPKMIDGPTIVRPYDTGIQYSVKSDTAGEFVVSNSKVKIDQTDYNTCVVDILTGKSGSFTLSYLVGDESIDLDVQIKSL